MPIYANDIFNSVHINWLYKWILVGKQKSKATFKYSKYFFAVSRWHWATFLAGLHQHFSIKEFNTQE